MRIPAAMSPNAMDSVTLTEADMNDPDLNAELAAVLGESVPSRPAAAARAPDHGSDSDAALRQQISAKKKLALQLRATDKPAAIQALREALREAKQLEATLKARSEARAAEEARAAAEAKAAELVAARAAKEKHQLANVHDVVPMVMEREEVRKNAAEEAAFISGGTGRTRQFRV